MRLPLLLLALPLLPLPAQPAPRILVGGEEERGAMLGSVEDVAIVPGGFVVLDAAGPALRFFDPSGRLRQAIGRTGAGPGEFRSPRSLYYDAARRRLLVTDPQNARLTAYVVGDSLTLAEMLPVDLPMLIAVCQVRDQLIGFGGTSTTLLHDLGISSGRLAAGRERAQRRSAHTLSRHPLLASYMGEGPRYCDDNRTVVATSPSLGEVLVWRGTEGTMVDLLPVPGFEALVFTASGPGALTLSAPASNRYDRVAGVTAAPGGGYAITSERLVVTDPRRVEVAYYWTVELSRAGVFSAPRRSQWRPLGTLGGATLCFSETPVPSIASVDARWCP